ncbi:MAG: glycosyltransferase [Hamadaea sp.]|nr:glycosyltransferase [Hamadaea sp.]
MLASPDLHPTSAVPPRTVRRIAHFSDTYLPRRDGVIASMHTLQRALAGQGVDSLTVVPQHPKLFDDPRLLPLNSIPVGVANLRLASWPMRHHVARIGLWQPDLVHIHTPGPVGLLGVLAAERLGLPVVHTYHTDLHAYADAYRIPKPALAVGLDLYRRRLGAQRPVSRAATRDAVLDEVNRLLLGTADAVVVPTPAILERAVLPVPAERIFLVPAAVHGGLADPGDAALFRARHAIAPDEQIVLFVGRVNREKGVGLLLASFAQGCAGLPKARLVLVGAVYERRRLRRMITRHGLDGRVTVTGQLPPFEVAAGYAAADVFAFPSQTDTQGLVLQEAALAGVPSVLADPALHRTGALGPAAVLAAPEPHAFGAALHELLTDRAAARRIGARARERAQALTPGRYAETMRDVYAYAAARRS